MTTRWVLIANFWSFIITFVRGTRSEELSEEEEEGVGEKGRCMRGETGGISWLLFSGWIG